MLISFIHKLLRKENLSAEEMIIAVEAILSCENEAQISAFLVLLKAKGETTEEIYGLVKAMQAKMLKIEGLNCALDIVGTGGDGFNTINISTASAILAASCGVKVVKHGNRSVSSLSGSADVLEKLGININMSSDEIKRSIEQTNFGFCYAPNFHPALGKIKEIRKKLKIPTVFNLVGPLLNPAQAEFLMMGVADPSYLNVIAQVLVKLGINRALVFHGCGLDEICTLGKVNYIEINKGLFEEKIFDARDYGFEFCTIEQLRGGSAEENANAIIKSLQGTSNALSDALILNAGLANYLYGLSQTVAQGIELARKQQTSGQAYQLLQRITHKNSNLLEEIIKNKYEEVAVLKNNKIFNEAALAVKRPSKFKHAISGSELAIIGEIKRKSPSKGAISNIVDPLLLLNQYVQGGVSAVSVLTEQKYFAGSPDDLKAVVEELKTTDIAVLRKDFIIDSFQLLESVSMGADAVLLIVAVLKTKTADLLKEAKNLGLDVIVEVHNLEELHFAIEIGADIIGINNRNLSTFSEDINCCLNLISYIPENILTIAESAIKSAADAEKIRSAGFNAILIGEALVRSTNPCQFLQEIRGELC